MFVEYRHMLRIAMNQARLTYKGFLDEVNYELDF